jgi:hypothetical protein
MLYDARIEVTVNKTNILANMAVIDLLRQRSINVKGHSFESLAFVSWSWSDLSTLSLAFQDHGTA